MVKLQGEKVYLAVLERKDCKKLYEDFEYDYNSPAEPLYIGYSVEKSDEWFDEIQKLQGGENIRLGIFLNSGTVIGDVALQSIDNKNVPVLSVWASQSLKTAIEVMESKPSG